MAALLFGSISSIADTSELQRDAFNEAFQAHDLTWHWDQEQYRSLLTSNGGQQRISDYAAGLGEEIAAADIHATKSRLFQQKLQTAELTPRTGIANTVRDAHEQGWKVALVTTTSADNIAALLNRLAPALPAAAFDLVVDASAVSNGKPYPDVYTYALSRLNEQPESCVAIEDNVGGVNAAEAAHVTCVAFPNVNTAGHDFGAANVIDTPSFTRLRALVSRA